MKKSFLFILALAIVSIGVSYAADCDVAAPSCAPAPTCGCAKCGNVFSGMFECCNNRCAQQPACSNCGSPANACCCNKVGCNPCRPCFAPLFQPRCTYTKPACKSDWYPGKNLGILGCLFGSPCCDPCAPKCGCGAPTCNSCNPCAPKCGPVCNPCVPKCAPAAPACGCGAPACKSCNPCCDPCTVGNRCGKLSCAFCGAKAACAPSSCAPAAAPTPAEPGAAPEAAPAAPAEPAPVAACAPATCSPCAAPATCAPATCAPATCAPSCSPCAPIARCEVNCGIVEEWYPGKGIINFLRVLTAANCLNNSCGCGAPTCNACNPCAPKCAPAAPACGCGAPKCNTCNPCAPVASCEPRKACCEFRPFGGLFADLFACNPCAQTCGCGAPACNACNPCAPKCAPACNPCAPKCAPATPCAAAAPKCAPASPCAAASPACAPAATVACQPASDAAPTPAPNTILPEPNDSVNSKSILSPSEMSTASLGSITE